jgi:hypothetical protein
MAAFRASLIVLVLVPSLAHAAGQAVFSAGLGPLEKGAVDQALAERGLTIDSAPDGKVVGAIHVVNLDVFQASDGALLQWFNHFHRTTREHHIRRESLLLPGMAYDGALVEETMRNLRNRTIYSQDDAPLASIVAIVPVQSSAPRTVDLLMVTRDVWSLRFNSDYNYEPGYLINFSASLSENNLFGWRKQAALTLQLNQGDVWFGPNYLDPNVLGTRLRLTLAAYEIWARKLGEIAAGPREGYSLYEKVEYPFYALSQRWGGFVTGGYTTHVVRAVVGPMGAQGVSLRRFDPDASACVLPTAANYSALTADCAYRSRTANMSSALTRSFPRSGLIQRITVGNEFGLNRPSFLPDFPTEQRTSFAQRYFGISERTSDLYLQYDAFTPRYRTYRDLDTYDLAEDTRLGPWVTLKLGRASTLLGSEADFFVLKAETHVNMQVLGGFQSVGASWESREYSFGLRDQLWKANVRVATPVVARAFRVVGLGEVGLMADNLHRTQVYVGGLEGLRGYPVNTFLGYDYYVAHLEVRSLAVPVSSLRLGALLFGDAGHAADLARSLAFYSDAGAGLRLLIPQLNADVLRCDWAFPFRAYFQTRAGWPGRLSCGFRQVF